MLTVKYIIYHITHTYIVQQLIFHFYQINNRHFETADCIC